MTTINLYQATSEEKEENVALKFGKSLAYPIAVILITLLIFAGFKVAVKLASDRNQEIISKLKTENDGFSEQNSVLNIIDTQKRIAEIKKSLESHKVNDVNLAMDNLSSEIAGSATLKSYKYDKGKIAIVINAGSFSDISRQIFNLKTSKNFVDVDLKNVARVESGIDMTIEMIASGTIAANAQVVKM